MQLIDFGNAGSHHIVGGPINQGWRERTALLLDSSAQIHFNTDLGQLGNAGCHM